MLAWRWRPCGVDRSAGQDEGGSQELDFEEAANLRDRVKQLRQKMAGTS